MQCDWPIVALLFTLLVAKERKWKFFQLISAFFCHSLATVACLEDAIVLLKNQAFETDLGIWLK